MKSAQHIQQYIGELDRAYRAGDATELSYRGALERLLRQLMPAVEVIHEPKRLPNVGAPDFLIKQTHAGQQTLLLGCVETKNIGDGDLEGKGVNKAQFTRYKEGVPSCIFTDYLTFVFYSKSHGELEKVAIGEASSTGIKPLADNFARFEALLAAFQQNYAPKIDNAQALARHMAGNARLLADITRHLLESEQSASLRGQFKAFRKILLPDISAEEFSDIYAQTVAHGMLTARLNAPDDVPFTRRLAPDHIPRTNPFIRKLLDHIVGIDIEPKIEWLVDGLANMFALSNVRKIMQGNGAGAGDAGVHFYETFLAEYDPALREARGVWYTPAPAVKFIVQAVHQVLKKEFKIKDGLADSTKITIADKNATGEGKTKAVHQVQILDPAVGTGTFLMEIIRCIREQMKETQGAWEEYVQSHLLPRLNGFELLVASYAVAHMQLELLLRDTGVSRVNGQHDRFRVYLTNSLEEYDAFTGPLLEDWLNEEAREAGKVKDDTPIMCVIGNPPYRARSTNRGNWIMRLMGDYKKEPGGEEKLREVNMRPVDDDYVKFIRYGQHYIEKNGSGVLAFINAHGFLDNLTLRGMRWSLLNTYDKIYILDLHGNTKKKETAPDGGVDQNVFDIMQGVSINIFIKTGKKKKGALAKVLHCDLYGTREDKYNFLSSNSLGTVNYKEIQPQAPMYFMLPKDSAFEDEYNDGFSVKELFVVDSPGLVTGNDSLYVAHDEKELINKLKDGNIAPDTALIQPLSYRPFDCRFLYNDHNLLDRSRKQVMQHFADGENIGLVCVRRQPASALPANYFLSKSIIVNGYIRSDSVSIDTILPLYQMEKNCMYDGVVRRPNLDEGIIAKIADALSLTFTPEKTNKKGTFAPIDVLDYIYATMHSPAYREKYAEYLKIDYPRVPYPAMPAQEFWRLVKLGGELRQLHLLESVKSSKVIYPVKGGNRVEKIKYENEKVYINSEQYFGGVPLAAWEFYIGGYQPAQKWLKDRKGRALSFDDVAHYQKIIACLLRTGEVMREIDEGGG